jgi:hypothetical protein
MPCWRCAEIRWHGLYALRHEFFALARISIPVSTDEKPPMIPPLSYRLIPAVTAFLGALLAIFLTPRFQHYFWKRQKREELRLAVVAEANKLAAQFKSHYLFSDQIESNLEQALTFHQSWMCVEGQVNDLFDISTYQTFKEMYDFAVTVPLHSKQEILDRVARVTEFDRRRQEAMEALYKEIGIL